MLSYSLFCCYEETPGQLLERKSFKYSSEVQFIIIMVEAWPCVWSGRQQEEVSAIGLACASETSKLLWRTSSNKAVPTPAKWFLWIKSLPVDLWGHFYWNHYSCLGLFAIILTPAGFSSPKSGFICLFNVHGVLPVYMSGVCVAHRG